jgi:hypothetical protein
MFFDNGTANEQTAAQSEREAEDEFGFHGLLDAVSMLNTTKLPKNEQEFVIIL